MHKKVQTEKIAADFGLPGVGKQIVSHLSRLNIYSVKDLLFHLPIRYQDRTVLQPIVKLMPSVEAVIEGTIEKVLSPKGGRTKLLCELSDGTGTISLRFFHVVAFQLNALKVGVRLRCYSEVKIGPKGLEMVHPEFKLIKEGASLPIDSHLTPIYPATEGLHQYLLRKLTTNALHWMEREMAYQEFLPATLMAALNFPTYKEALTFVHRPPRESVVADLLENKTRSQKRLIFEELLAHRISLLQLKQLFKSQQSVPLISQSALTSKFHQQLSFKLTRAQTRVIEEIKNDLAKNMPMLRLVQGDVGSGKTVIAASAMLQAIESGYQSVLMAPTELLAEQHHRVFKNWFEPLGIQVVYLAGNLTTSARKKILTTISNGDALIIIGTHALFQRGVDFNQLALVIVDEQHRFGVEQRALLREKGIDTQFYPHQLIMTATPIPRTLAMSFYADLDCSVIDELPPGRTPIATTVLSDSRRDEVINRIREACLSGRQAYWVCPLIEESEVLACQSATETAEVLRHMLSMLKIGLIHGRMKSDEKEAVMRAFQQGETHLLVATTVIEVGVDVPNASLMVIENAERLGLSQLHQLRGRVGRGTVASHCVLLYHALTPFAKERLKVMRETTDGFKIAQRDLELRGPGDVLGTRQTGELSFRIADLLRDSEMLPAVQKAADIILQNHADIIPQLLDRWVGEDKKYGRI